MLAGLKIEAATLIEEMPGDADVTREERREAAALWVAYMDRIMSAADVPEVLRRKPLPAYLDWLAGIPQECQYVSAVSVGELYKGAFRSANPDRFLTFIEERLITAITVLPYDVAVAKVFGQVRAALESRGKVLEDSDLQIAATAVHHGLELVTGNIAHFERVPGLKLCHSLASAR